jgi:hypothetical protein
VRAVTAGGTDDTDGADGIFITRAHPDHSRPRPAFTQKRDLDAQCAEERLRPPQRALILSIYSLCGLTLLAFLNNGLVRAGKHAAVSTRRRRVQCSRLRYRRKRSD